MTVGVFDSGVGGLTVLRECEAACPAADFVFLGDNGNAPYGNRSEEEIAALVSDGAERLLACGAGMIVLACNTATAVCADRLRRECPVPVVGMEPAVKTAAAHCRRALLLATARTAESGRLRTLLARFPQCEFFVYGSAGLAGAVEDMLLRGKEARLADYLPAGDFDGVVLGCTHYVFLREAIAARYGAPVFDGNRGTALRVRALLGAAVDNEGAKNTKTNKSSHSEWSTGGARRVDFIGKYAAQNREIYERMFKNA